MNTGVPSGLDLDRNGSVGAQGRERGNDAWGYGLHPGQYGMLVLSRFPINEASVRTFQLLRWSTLPGAANPVDPTTRQPFYTDHVWTQLRMSSKSHWDVPVRTPGGTVHFLVSHPTPPVFDGPENRNGLRNADEIRLWREYLTPGDAPWLCDDQGRCGCLPADARFVIAGDLNNDPADGDGQHEAIVELLEHPRLTRGKVEVRRLRVTLAAIVDEAVETVRAQYDEAGDATASMMAMLAAGDPQDSGTVCGPVISARQRDRTRPRSRGWMTNYGSALG